MKWRVLSTLPIYFAASSAAHAEGLVEVVERVNTIWPVLTTAVLNGGFFVGLCLGVYTFYTLVTLGRSSMNNYGSIRNPIYSFLAAIGLIYVTSFIGLGGETIFGSSAQNLNVSGEVEMNY